MAASATEQLIELKYPVIIFPADGRAPHLDDMPVSTAGPDPYTYGMYSETVSLVPHPQIHMEYIADARSIGQPAHQALVSASPHISHLLRRVCYE
jgi:hypothetical protein